MKTVLFVDSQSARWLKLEIASVTDSHVTSFEDAEFPDALPSWFNVKSSRLHVVVDCVAEEVELESVPQGRYRLLERLSQQVFESGVCERHAHSPVQRVRMPDTGGQLSITHFNLEADIGDWLLRVAGLGVVIQSVQSINMLAARLYCDAQDSGLLVFRHHGHVHHVLHHKHSVLFTRALVDGAGNAQLQIEQIEQTLRHAFREGLCGAPVDVFLAADVLPEPGSLTEPLVGDVEIVRSIKRLHATLPDNAAGYVEDENASRQVSLAGIAGNLANLCHLSARVLTENYRERRLLVKLKCATAVMLLIATSTVAYALSEAVDSVRSQNTMQQQHSDVKNDIQGLSAQGSEIHPQFGKASDALQKAQSIALQEPAVLRVLQLVAHALDEHDHIELQALSWTARSVNRNLLLLDGVVVKERLEVLIHGNVTLPQALRAQQTLFNAFTDTLRADDDVEQVTVDNSPLLQASQRGTQMHAQAENQAIVEPAFALTLWLKERSDPEG